MKPIDQLSEATLKQRLKAINALPERTPANEEQRTQIENRLWALYREKHPPIHTPKNFLEREEEW